MRIPFILFCLLGYILAITITLFRHELQRGSAHQRQIKETAQELSLSVRHYLQYTILFTIRLHSKSDQLTIHSRLILSCFHKFFNLIFGNEAEYMFEDANTDDVLVAMGGGNGAHTEKGVVLDFHLGSEVEFAD